MDVGKGVLECRGEGGSKEITGGQKYPNLPSMPFRFLSQRQRKILVRVAPVERQGHMSGRVTQAKEASKVGYGVCGGVW